MGKIVSVYERPSETNEVLEPRFDCISHNGQDISFWAQVSSHKQGGGFLLNLAL